MSLRGAAAAAWAAAFFAIAAHAAGEEAAAKRPTVYALVSAVGDQFSFVRQRLQVGTHFEPYSRYTAKVQGDALNAAVLRGLDRAVAEGEPGSERVFVKLNPAELANVAASDRERVAIGKLVQALENLPERKGWDRIIAVTPAFLRSERRGMAGKLQGIGVFVQPLERGRTGPAPGLDLGLDTTVEPDTESPSGKPTRSSVFVAPFFYTKLWVLDARTLEVLETEGRYDFRKIWDPLWTAVDVSGNLPPEALAGEVEKFVERASARALHETMGTVTVSEPRVVPSAPRAKERP